MKTNSRSQSNPNTEHQFAYGIFQCDNVNKLVQESIEECDEQLSEREQKIIKQAMQNLVEKLIKYIQLEKRKRDREKQEDGRDLKKVVILSTILLLVFMWMIESVLKKLGLDIVIHVAGVFLNLFMMGMGCIANKDEILKPREEGVGFIRDAKKTAKRAFYVVTHVSIIPMLMYPFIMFAIAGILVSLHAPKIVTAFVEGGYMAVSDMMSGEQTISITHEDEVILAADEVTLSILAEKSIEGEELIRELNLSTKDYNIVFFQEGRYDISGKSQDEVNGIVHNFVEECKGQSLPNIFDMPESEGGAPSELANAIAAASEKEVDAESFSEIVEILNTREVAYSDYPKRSLAVLVSNGYQDLALLLYINKGSSTTMTYYYSQSILWRMDALCYDETSDNTLKDYLANMAQRYRDIIYINQELDDTEAVNAAKMLAIAFQKESDSY